MEISFKKSVYNSGPVAGNLNTGAARSYSTAKTGRKSVREDEVVFSSGARAAGDVTNLFHSLPDVREDMVARIREKINGGAYEIDGDRIAVKMITESLLDNLT